MADITTKQGSRRIFGFMAFTITLSVLGAEIRNVKRPQGPNVPKILEDPPIIILGGAVATTMLVLLGNLGEQAEKFATGIAGLALLSAFLFNAQTILFVVNANLTGQNTISGPGINSSPIPFPSTGPNAAGGKLQSGTPATNV